MVCSISLRLGLPPTTTPEVDDKVKYEDGEPYGLSLLPDSSHARCGPPHCCSPALRMTGWRDSDAGLPNDLDLQPPEAFTSVADSISHLPVRCWRELWTTKRQRTASQRLPTASRAKAVCTLVALYSDCLIWHYLGLQQSNFLFAVLQCAVVVLMTGSDAGHRRSAPSDRGHPISMPQYIAPILLNL